ncbi:MAG TPA: PEGA domain-containing protein [Bryobacteraceae bacterium]|nr:PEGA domain-containing protein [Bryobacteraceae bacterium]
MKKALLAIAGILVCIAPAASAAPRGVIVARPYFGGYYQPFWGSYWGPAWAGPYYAYPTSGEIKLETKVRDAGVFINGAYSGTTHENKTMRLRPGRYDIEIRDGGQTRFAEHVYVIAGKTLHLHPIF